MLVRGLIQPAIDWLRCGVAPWSRNRDQSRVAPKGILDLFVPLFAVNLVVLSLCAPYIRVDGSVYTATVMRDFVVPHSAPLYPIFVRSVNAVIHNAGIVVGCWPATDGPAWSLVQPVPYSNASIYALLLLQHLFLVVSASWFAVSITNLRWLRFVTACSLCWSPSTLLAAQRVQTEGLWHPLLIAAAASCVRFLAPSHRPLRSLVLHGVFVTLAMLVRHPGNVFLAMLPLAVVLRGLLAVRGTPGRDLLGSHLRAVIIITCGGLMALGLVARIKTEIMIGCGVEPRSAFGRPGTQRIHPKALHPFERISRHDLEEIVRDLELRTEDQLVREAMTIITTSQSFWVEPFNRIRSEIVEREFPDLSYRETLAPTDRLLNEVALLAYTSTDPRMLRSIVLRTVRFLQLGPSKDKCGRGPLVSSRQCMDRAVDASEWPWLTDGLLAGVSAARDRDKLKRTLLLEWTEAVVRPVESRILWLVLVALVAVSLSRRSLRTSAALAIALVTTGVVYSVLSSVVAGYSARRSEVIVLLLVCAASLLCSEVAEGSTEPEADTGEIRPSSR